MNNTRNLLILFFVVVFSSTAFAQNYSISGTIDNLNGDPIEGAEVLIEDLNLKTITDKNGNYQIKDLPMGVHTIKVSSKTFRTLRKNFYIKSEQFIGNFRLQKDLLGLHQQIETGNIKPHSNLTSSTAVSIISSDEIAFKTSHSTASVLSNTPGFTVEATSGDSGNNLFSRGMSSGEVYSPEAPTFFDNESKTARAFKFVQLQEDGLPVFEDGALEYAGSDVFARADLTVDRIESMRGGNAAVATSGAPGGIINMISKTGQNELNGVAKVTGSEFGLFRFDTNVGGAIIKDTLYYNVGGFYRTDPGIRPTNFNANNGGQIKANLKYKRKNLETTLFLKYLNDRNTFYHGVPLVYNNGSIESFGGFDPNIGTLAYNFGRIGIPQPGGNQFTLDLSEGVHPRSFVAGSSFKINPMEQLKIENSLKFTHNQLTFNGIFAPYDFSGIQSQNEYSSQKGALSPIYTSVSDGRTLNSAIELLEVEYRFVDKEITNLSNQLKLDFQIDPYSLLSGGYYFSSWKSEQLSDFSSLLVTATNNPRLVNLTSGRRGYTSNGVSNISFEKKFSEISNTVHALFANFDSELTDRINLDLGIRYDVHRYSGRGDNGTPIPSNSLLINNTSDDKTKTLSGNFLDWDYNIQELSYSGGLAYMFSENKSAFIHFSRGFRAPTEETFYHQGVSFGSNQLAGLRPVSVIQLESGYKHSQKNLALLANVFYLNMGNIIYQPGRSSSRTRDYGNIQNIGLELEAAVRFHRFKALLNGTVQNPRYTNFIFTNTASSGSPNNQMVRRIPLYQLGLTPSFQVNRDFNIFATWNRVGESYNDQSNSLKLPAYDVFGFGGTYRIQRFLIGLDVTNILNSVGVTEAPGLQAGDGLATGSEFLGRPILGRAARLALTYHFDEKLFEKQINTSF